MDQLEFASKLMTIMDHKIMLLDTIRSTNRRLNQLDAVMETPHGYNMGAYEEGKNLQEEQDKLISEINQELADFFLELSNTKRGECN
ncbi:MAG: hypothetical protein GKS07_07340 [Nitrosopumilus sp.]|nr:MAG: hypothetical protein GKS07_07340 [Nitrosopumilus sp.]